MTDDLRFDERVAVITGAGGDWANSTPCCLLPAVRAWWSTIRVAR